MRFIVEIYGMRLSSRELFNLLVRELGDRATIKVREDDPKAETFGREPGKP